MAQPWRVSEEEQCGAADEGRCCCWKAPLSVLSKELGVLPVRAGRVGGVRVASSAHHRDGPASLLGPVSMGKEQRAVCSGGSVLKMKL